MLQLKGIAVLLLQPGLALIDHGHFQYPSCSSKMDENDNSGDARCTEHGARPDESEKTHQSIPGSCAGRAKRGHI